MFQKEIYIERRKVLKEKVGEGLILLFGNDESSMNYADNTYHFRQDSTFLYFFGIQHPGLAAVIDIDNDKEIIFGNDYTIDDIVWMGPQPTIADRAALCGVSTVFPMKELASVVEKSKKIHFLPLYRPENKIKLFELIDVAPKDVANTYSLELVKEVVSQREIKSKEEIEQLHQAVNVSVDMHVAAMKFARPGMTEAQVASEIHKVALAAGGNIAFPIIATKNGQTLHNHFHGNTIKEGDLFLVDAGYENELSYSGDLSSTFPVSIKFTPEQKEIYEIALAGHEAAIRALEFGKPYKNAHIAAATTIFDGLKSMGFTKGNAMDAFDAGAHALFFPCGTGHMMGMDVHDMEDLGEVWVGYDGQPKSTQFGLKSLRLAKPLRAGHVFTIEPGIYFIPELIDLWRGQGKFNDFINWEKVDSYRNFGGIRNEEDFVMTENGVQLLGKPKPKTVEDVEALRG
ncbi:aminopeptidase P family protein [Draconibacterium sp. IB214405]|uniref:aminopeptidase P family protein n=1 Tax=Draconibacterium sp. IB214405 TaxID=3097352 RepID=UPI002A15AEB9|nr:aminopeptidase P family protein [Draconibacterium sp. IB214405]MDX8337648.1 aminopeptidase P family protein [Draconibacterium sp. IB214405]